MFAGLPISFSIVAVIALIIIGVAVLGSGNEPGAGIACLITAAIIFVSGVMPGCRKSCTEYGRKTLSISKSKVSCKGSKLCDKLEDLVELRQKLTAKKSEVRNLVDEYRSSIKQLETEIRNEKRSNKINTYAEAKNNQRISYDLSLIQRKQAYIAKLEEVLPKLDTGANELEYLQRQTEDDIKMERVLGDKEIEKLTEQIDKTISRYLPEADDLVISVDESTLEAPQSIWQRVVGD